MHDVSEQDVVEILRRGHSGPPDQIDGTIARVLGHGPFKRVTLSDHEIGRLRFQPPKGDRQVSLRSFFRDDVSLFGAWLNSLDQVARARQQVQIDQFASSGTFTLPPVYDFEGQVLDGGHRTRAAYYVYRRAPDAAGVSLEIICDVQAIASFGQR